MLVLISVGYCRLGVLATVVDTRPQYLGGWLLITLSQRRAIALCSSPWSTSDHMMCFLLIADLGWVTHYSSTLHVSTTTSATIKLASTPSTVWLGRARDAERYLPTSLLSHHGRNHTTLSLVRCHHKIYSWTPLSTSSIISPHAYSVWLVDCAWSTRFMWHIHYRVLCTCSLSN
jgi:hypothetical protein